MTSRMQSGSDEHAAPDAAATRIWPGAVCFVVLTFAFSAAMLWVQGALGIDPALISMVQFAPALGAAATVLALHRLPRYRCRIVLGSFGPAAAARLGSAVVAVVLVLGLMVVLCALAGVAVPVTGIGAVGPPVAALLLAQFVGACGEELGWRCLLQPLLRTRFGALTTGVVVGVVWGLWHVQILGLGPLYVLGFLAGTVGMSVLLAALLDRGRAPVLLIAGGFHFLINIGLLVFGDEETGAAAPELAFGAAALVVAIGAVVLGRRLVDPA